MIIKLVVKGGGFYDGAMCDDFKKGAGAWGYNREEP